MSTKQQYVSGDMLALIAEVNQRRIPQVCGKIAARNGGRLDLSDIELHNLMWARQLHWRMQQGDYRMSMNEWHRLRDLCEWLVRKHAENERQPEPQPVEWSESSMWAMMPLEKGTYQKLLRAVVTGQLYGG